MRLSRSKAHSAFGGQVTFVLLTYRALRMGIVLDELQRAFPDIFDAKAGKQYRQMLAFIFSFGHTLEIEFNLKDDAPDELIAFQEWWTLILPKGDYRAAYQSYLASVSEDIANAWANAVEATRAPSPAAPEELQPGAAERAEVDKDFTQPVSA